MIASFPKRMLAGRPALPSDCDVCPAKELGLFAKAVITARPQLVKHFHLEPLKAKETLFRVNEPGEYAYMVRRGLVKLVQYSPIGKERIVRLVRRSESFGMESVLGQRYKATAVAIVDSDLCQIPATAIRDQQQSNPNFAMDLMASMQDALDEANAFLLDLSTGPAQARVARLLLFMSGDGSSEECTLVTREEMGALLGITTETASRAVADLRRQDIIAVTGGDHFRCDITALKRIAAAE